MKHAEERKNCEIIIKCWKSIGRTPGNEKWTPMLKESGKKLRLLQGRKKPNALLSTLKPGPEVAPISSCKIFHHVAFLNYNTGQFITLSNARTWWRLSRTSQTP